MDIVLCSKKSIKIFGDKGIYPIETVFGVFSITATLSKPKFMKTLLELATIPKSPKFIYHKIKKKSLMTDPTMKQWNQLIPYKCIFGFTGTINGQWVLELNNKIKNNSIDRHLLPDIIIVNKVGMIEKIHERINEPYDENLSYYHFTDFSKYKNPGSCFPRILNHLHMATTWENVVMPDYVEYFKKDL